MAENSRIEWCHHTFNPWIGCTKLTAACDNCYAETERAVTCLGVTWGAGQPRHRTAASTWKQPLAWNRKAAKEGIRHRVFCASLADVFDAEVPDTWRDELFALIAATPHLDWLLLTKRPKVMRDYADRAQRCGEHWLADQPGTPAVQWPLPNVWLGTTVEDQKMADLRIPDLLNTPATVHFLSMEPLLGPVDLTSIRATATDAYDLLRGEWRVWMEGGIGDAEPGWSYRTGLPRLDQVITGGESGPGARPSHPDWFRSIRDQCAAAGVAYLHKQNGEWWTGYTNMTSGDAAFRRFETFEQWVNKAPTWVQGGICLDVDGKRLEVGADFMAARDAGKFPVTIMHRVGKKVAGRQLDGVLHDGYPAPKVQEVSNHVPR